MAKKVFLQDLNENKILPITRGELILDSSGKEAFHSSEFLANNSLPGLMSAADKIKLDILSNIPYVIGKDSDTKSKWTGESDAITLYVDGLSLIYVPKVAGTVNKLTLLINELPAKSITISENDYTTADIAAGSPLLLTYSSSSDKWVTTDCNQAFDIPNHVWICEDINKTKIIARGTYAVSPNSYVPIIMPGANSQTSVSMRFFGTGSTFYPVYLNGKPVSAQNYGIPKGFYLVYFDGSYVHLNTNGILPGKIDKSVVAENVQLNNVEGEGSGVDSDYETAEILCTSLTLTKGKQAVVDTVDVIKADTITAEGDGSALEGTYNYANVPTTSYLLSNYKPKQNPVLASTYTISTSPSMQFVSQVEQDADGVISVSKKEILASDLGLSKVMQYIGKTETSVVAHSTNGTVEIGGNNVAAKAGDVVISKFGVEYIWNGTYWEEFGNEGGYKLKQTAVTDPAAAEGEEAILFISSITQNENGVISPTKKTVRVAAKDKLGLVKTSSSVTSITGYEPVPIVNGIPYYRDTNIYVSSAQWNAGTTKGPTLTLTKNNETSCVTKDIPSASETASGIVTIAALTFKGAKTFKDTVVAPRVDCAVGATTLSNTAKAHSITYISGGKTISTAVSNDSKDVAYAGSSSVYGVYSYPEGSTAVSGGIANIMNLRLTWSDKFFHDIYCSPNQSHLWHRRIWDNGNSGWSRIMTENKSGTNYVYDAAVNKIAYLDSVAGSSDGSTPKHNVDCNLLSGFGLATNYHHAKNYDSAAENTLNTGSWIHFPKSAYGGVFNIGSGSSVIQGQLAWTLNHSGDYADTTGDLYWRASAIKTSGATSIWDKASWKKIAYYNDAKYCNNAILKTADFPEYGATAITNIDPSVKDGGKTEQYFKALCKYLFSIYKNEQASNAAITLLGQARPGSTGTALISLYNNSGYWTTDSAMPKFVSGLYIDLSGLYYTFGSAGDGVWYWKRGGTVTSITPGTGLTRTNDAGDAQVDTAITASGTINLKKASTTEIGGVKVIASRTSAITTNSATSIANRYYGVEIDSNSKAFVNVPWTNTTNTAGSTNNTAELFIIGAATQDTSVLTYSHSGVKLSGDSVKASGGFYQESDERLKDFTEDVSVDLEQLSQLPKKHFTWKDDDKKETQIGTSAQELQKLYPELVKEDSNGTLSVAYDKLSIIALKAIDELYKRNVELEKRIQELENK